MNKTYNVYRGEDEPKNKDVVWIHHTAYKNLGSPITAQIYSNGTWVDINESRPDIPQIQLFDSGSGEYSVVQKQADTIMGMTVPVNNAFSQSTICEGAGNTAGLKGFKYTDTGEVTNTLTLENNPPSGLKTGMVVSIINDSKYPDCSTITNISEKTITFDSLPFAYIKADFGYDSKCIYVSSNPELGDIDLGIGAHAEGVKTQASNLFAHSEGFGTKALGQYSHAEGRETIAQYTAHAEGRNTEANGSQSHAEGKNTIAKGISSHAEGMSTSALVDYTHVEGFNTTANGNGSHAEGYSDNICENPSDVDADVISAWENKKFTLTKAGGAHAEGRNTLALSGGTHAEGYETIAKGSYGAHSEGYQTHADGKSSHAEGESSVAGGINSHAEGTSTSTAGNQAHAEGNKTIATGNSSHAEGYLSQAIGGGSHAEGRATVTKGEYAHAEGQSDNIYENISAIDSTVISDWASKKFSFAKANYSHVEGLNTLALSAGCHAEGYQTIAQGGRGSHSEGQGTRAIGESSHAEGISTTASGNYSHAEGDNTIANNLSEHAEGRYNVSHQANSTFGNAGNTIHSVGIGTANNARKNAFEIMQNGLLFIIGVNGYTGSNPDKTRSVQAALESVGITVDWTVLGYNS